MFGGDRFEPCSPPDFYCDGGCKLRFDRTRMAPRTHSFCSDSPSKPDLSQRNFDVMVVLTVLTGRTKLIVKN